MQAILVMFKSDGSRKDFVIKSDRKYIIGRKETSDLRIPMTNVSREHAAVYFDKEDDELVIEDLGSSNGTYVNNEKVDIFDLCPGDVIVVGSVPLQVVIDGHPAKLKPIQMKDMAGGSDSDNQNSSDAVTFISDAPSQQKSVYKDEINLANDDDDDVVDIQDNQKQTNAKNDINMPDESGSFFDFDVMQNDKK